MNLRPELPASLQNVLAVIRGELHPKRIILFGSRARGDFRANSDFDLCLVGAKLDPVIRAKVNIAVAEDPLTLHKIDLVFYEDISKGFRKNIDREGVVLYVE